MQKVLVFFLLLGTLLIMSCDDSLTAAEQALVDEELIESYVADQGLTGAYTSSGLFIATLTPGDVTERPTINSNVTVIYEGSLLNGEVFDSSEGDSVTFPLFRLIPGWQEGLQLMGRGEESVMVIPSADAYGPAGVGGIPGNAVLRFDITLVDFE